MALDLSKVDVYEFLSELGLNNVREERNDVWYSCFSDQHYRGDVNPSASMEKGTTKFYCFACGMHGNAVSFLAELENVSPIQSAIWIKERFVGASVPDQETLVENVKKALERKTNQRSHGEQNVLLDEIQVQKRRLDWSSEEAWLAYSGPDVDTNDTPIIYMLDRGFSSEILNKFEIGWDKISERISIPVRDADGNLIGFKGRSIERMPRYIVLGGPEYGFEPYQTKQILFGLDKVGKVEELIVCEGELNAIAMHQHGYTNTVGISGKILSDEQCELIKNYGKKVVLIFDEEEDAINAAKKLRRFIPTAIVPDHDKDPADMDATEIAWLLQSQKSSLISLQ